MRVVVVDVVGDEPAAARMLRPLQVLLDVVGKGNREDLTPTVLELLRKY